MSRNRMYEPPTAAEQADWARDGGDEDDLDDYEAPQLRCLPVGSEAGGCSGCRRTGYDVGKTLAFRGEGPGGATVFRLCRKCLKGAMSSIRSFLR